MKKIKVLFSGLLFISLVFLTSCGAIDNNNDDDEDIRAKFLGVWSVSESCSKRVYSVEIKIDQTNSARVLIYNFADPGAGVGGPAYGFVTTNRITLDPSHTIGDDWTVTGDGLLSNNNRMEWTYSLVISGSEQECTAVYTR